MNQIKLFVHTNDKGDMKGTINTKGMRINQMPTTHSHRDSKNIYFLLPYFE